MKSFRLLSTLCVLFPALAWSGPVHNVWSTSPFFIKDGNNTYNATSGNSALSWNESTGYAFANARATSSLGDVYEFQLVSTTATTTSYEIVGTWNVTKNGSPLCTNCTGSAYGLNMGVGSYFKIYVSGETYGLSAYVTSVFNY
ncbi:hypothetical protein [Vitiosangium sp. GDMCC 1.1324]|uniref:hypothetical protein n=1 Tax=Vitiosangium sp. (strain GDMCC 1.1324) TaxID=2138576 RepID=UPI000D33A415|nr:hypothetical protein [Vitiosangium sp. GDMCC 1.1324]PTL82694.1 hypothetical protein DAT35_18115 [Vitiosangium sp. GDMCC 1.1324]